MAIRRKSRLLALVFLAGIVVFAASAGKLLVVDDPRPSDVALVLAGETDYRPALALRLLEQKYAQKVVIDVPAGAKIYEFTQLDLARKYIQDLPQAAQISVCPIVGLSTRDESHDAEKCLGENKHILIVTSDYHTRRALSIFRHELHGKEFSTAAARDATQFGEHWWKQREWAKTCFYEWLRLVWWKGIDQWRH